ncbi:MAG: C45 family autoproteolytic acyltransferase/hydrolase, partial [Alphaproteobacteria bacterium]|nr:C45 family autoproteolytic acyltransferase/hydrolase [Alphaproteobacteria bacterium]
MKKTFKFYSEDRPGAPWAKRFQAGRDEARAWYTGQGRSNLPSSSECRDALKTHMPELIDAYDQACALLGAMEIDRCVLSHYRPAPEASGCSIDVWIGGDGPALVRNYDFPLEILSNGFEYSNWSGRKVISKAQRPWGGFLDGMNDDGLVAALTYGGGVDAGQGFSVILILRYLMETCSTVEQALEKIVRVPIALSHNVTLLDASGAYATVFLGPNRRPAITDNRVSVNHQEIAGAATGSLERQETISGLLSSPDATL